MVRRLYAGSDEIVKRYVGSNLTHLVEWRQATRTESIPFNTIQYDDPNRDKGTSATTTWGSTGSRTYSWTEELVNGVLTGNRTNEVESSYTAPVDRRIAVGTRLVNYISSTTERVLYSGGSSNVYKFIRTPQNSQWRYYNITFHGARSGSTISLIPFTVQSENHGNIRGTRLLHLKIDIVPTGNPHVVRVPGSEFFMSDGYPYWGLARAGSLGGTFTITEA